MRKQLIDVFHYLPDQYKTQEVCGRVASEDSFYSMFS